jgi:hypothetical protein
MSRKFDPESERQFHLGFSLRRMTKFEPEKTGPFNRSHYVSFSLSDLLKVHLFGLRDQALPMAHAILAWMEVQPDPPEGNDMSECFRAYQWWETLGLCKWLIDGEPAAPAFERASEADWRHWDKFQRFERDGAKLLLREGLEHSLPLNLAARRPAVGLQLCEAAGLTDKASSAPPLQAAELMYGRWACRHLAEGGRPQDPAYVAKGEAMLRKALLSRFIEGDHDYTKMVLWLKAIYFDSGVTRTPEETIFKAYDTMPGIERPAFSVVSR